MTADKWVMHAQRQPEPFEGRDFLHFGEAGWVRMGYGGNVVQVVLVEDPDGLYWGWLPTGDGEGPTLVQPHQSMYSMQFPYGPTAEEEAGRGRTVRLTIREWACPRCGTDPYVTGPYGCPECGTESGPAGQSENEEPTDDDQ